MFVVVFCLLVWLARLVGWLVGWCLISVNVFFFVYSLFVYVNVCHDCLFAWVFVVVVCWFFG